MSDPLLTYHTTKDIGAVYQHLEAIAAADPMATQNMSLVRNTAAFFYILEKNGEQLVEWPKDRYSLSLDEMQAFLAQGDIGMVKVAATALFMAVQEIVRRWFDTVTTEEAVAGMQQQMHDSWESAPAEIQSMSQEQKDTGAQQTAEAMLAPHPGTILGVSEFDDPKCNDMCYVLWGATGDRRYIECAIKALSQSGDTTTRRGQVARTAAWSLRSLAEQYPEVKAIVIGVPGAAAKINYALTP